MTHVDRWVVRYVFTDWEVDPVRLLGKIGASFGVILDDVEHVRWTDTTSEQNPRGAEGASREDDTALGGQGDEAVRTNEVVVGLDASDLASSSDDIQDSGAREEGKVLPCNGSLVVSRDGAATLASNELKERH